MKINNYIDMLNNSDNDDIFPGMLSDLNEDLPQSFHSNIMNKIKNDNENIKYKHKSFINKKYISLAAACFVFVACMSNIKTVINNDDIISKQSTAASVSNAILNNNSSTNKGNHKTTAVKKNSSLLASANSKQNNNELQTKSSSEVNKALKNNKSDKKAKTPVKKSSKPIQQNKVVASNTQVSKTNRNTLVNQKVPELRRDNSVQDNNDNIIREANYSLNCDDNTNPLFKYLSVSDNASLINQINNEYYFELKTDKLEDFKKLATDNNIELEVLKEPSEETSNETIIIKVILNQS